MEEDKELEQLFAGYEPDMLSDTDFMARLEQGMKAIDAIRCQVADGRRRNRKAVVIAALTGFVSGSTLTAAVPYLVDAIAHWQQSQPASAFADLIAGNTAALAWAAVAAATIAVSVNVYELSLAAMKRR